MKQGIYRIHCIQSNKVYIGSSKYLRKRIHTHKSKLRKNIHHNKHLQAAWNKYGEVNFTFSTIEETEDLLNREYYWIKYYESDTPEKGYNFNNPLDLKEVTTNRKSIIENRKGTSVILLTRDSKKEFISVSAISKELNIKVGSLWKVVQYWSSNGERGKKTVNGYIILRSDLYNPDFDYFSFKKIPKPRVKKPPLPKIKKILIPYSDRPLKRIKVISENVETGVKETYNSITECKEQLNLNLTKLRKCLENPYKKYKHKGYYFCKY